MRNRVQARIAQKIGHRYVSFGGILVLMLLAASPLQAEPTEREQFVAAWSAASRGDHKVFSHLPQSLAQYELFPYLVYEDLRYRRAKVQPQVFADFLDQHADWAFTDGLRLAWLKTLGKRGRWSELLQYANGSPNTVVRCFRARAQLETGQTSGLLMEAQSLWTVGKSQPQECDPVFAWLNDNDGITRNLAWERIRLAMAGGNPRFTLYLERFVPPQERVWLSRWQELDRNRYRKLNQSLNWPDEELPRMITAMSLQRLAGLDAERAWQMFRKIDGHFGWPGETRGAILREIALQLAVALNAVALEVMATLPPSHRDDQILQWWARMAMSVQEWGTLQDVIGQMPAESKSDGRWRYWQAIATQKLGNASQAWQIQDQLSRESSYYGFLAADFLDRPYTICPQEPSVTQQAVTSLRGRPDISRSLELHEAGLENWALAEWSLASIRLDRQGLRTAAALAHQEGWHDRVIFALGDSGDRQYYDWRFPVLWEQQVEAASAANQLDAAWVHGVMRSESALVETARSSAGALGLMQITPSTAKRLARKHGMAYRGREQLTEADSNIRFGTRFMRDLLDRYNQNPVLVSGAYNAGSRAVDRWLDNRPRGEAAVWIETIPYFETRDYIPRVLAFTAIYDWRMQKPVTRISSRMPDLDSNGNTPRKTTEVECGASG